MEINFQSLKFDITLAECDTTAGHIIKTMLNDFPTAKVKRSCLNASCPEPTTYDMMYLTYQINDISLIGDLQQYLDERILIEKTKCKGNCITTLNTILSELGTFIYRRSIFGR